ncbi:hypothetical protein ABIE67_009700 [Streptomyces sp. V4I8]|uniref:hypothetical protein n=1 Tax=Streptomyces sp. V4I8 TaxID=3156469 RepID=UPI0035177635
MAGRWGAPEALVTGVYVRLGAGGVSAAARQGGTADGQVRRNGRVQPQMQVVAVEDRTDRDGLRFGGGAEMLRKEPHDKGVSCPGPLVQGSRVRQRQLDDPQGFPHLCGQAVDEDPPLGEELRGVATRA